MVSYEPVGYRLSETHLAVLRLLACGYSENEVAQALGLKYRKVRNHTYYIRSVLCAENNTHAVAIALSEQLIEFKCATD